MIRAAAMAASVALGALVLAAATSAQAGAPASVCSNDEVLDWVRQSLREREPYARLQPRTVNEAPGSAGDVVRCGVCLRPFSYDAARREMVPASRCEPHGYVVRTLPTGFLVLSVD